MASLSRKGKGARPRPHMNVTPLVDVVLVLLIIFMIVIPAMSEGVNLEVPAVTNPDDDEGEDGPEPVVLSVNRSGVLFIDERVVPEGDLQNHLRAAHHRHPASRLVLRGDRGVSYAQVRSLFSAAQGVGFPGISLRVNHQDGDRREP